MDLDIVDSIIIEHLDTSELDYRSVKLFMMGFEHYDLKIEVDNNIVDLFFYKWDSTEEGSYDLKIKEEAFELLEFLRHFHRFDYLPLLDSSSQSVILYYLHLNNALIPYSMSGSYYSHGILDI